MKENTDFHDYQLKAEKLMEIKRFREAIPLLTKAYIQNPQNHRTICSLSYCFFELHEDDKSQQYAEEAIAVDPEGEWGYRLRVIQLLRKGNFDEALKCAKKSLECEPESPLTLRNYISVLLKKDYYDEARKIADKLLEVAPDSANSFYISGHVNLQLKKLDEAEQDLRQALKIAPEFAEARKDLAIVILKKSYNEETKKIPDLENEALQHFSESVKLDPNNPAVLGSFKRQFYIFQYFFILGYLSPLFVAGLVITPIVTVILSSLLLLIIVYLLYINNQRKKKLSPELQSLLKIKDYPQHFRQLTGEFFRGGLILYRINWLPALITLVIFILYLYRDSFPFGDYFYLILKLAFWGNTFWIFYRTAKFAGPKQMAEQEKTK
jgi:tetratricopeptide (TPR) repeat protein